MPRCPIAGDANVHYTYYDDGLYSVTLVRHFNALQFGRYFQLWQFLADVSRYIVITKSSVVLVISRSATFNKPGKIRCSRN